MDRQSADRLVTKLGMTHELIGEEIAENEHRGTCLLDSDEAYQRFEQAIGNILEKLKGTKPRAYLTEKHYSLVQVPEFSSHYQRKTTTSSGYRQVEDTNRAIDLFRANYGIGVPQETQTLIASQYGVSLDAIGKKVRFIEQVLAQHHKREIWQGTI